MAVWLQAKVCERSFGLRPWLYACSVCVAQRRCSCGFGHYMMLCLCFCLLPLYTNTSSFNTCMSSL